MRRGSSLKFLFFKGSEPNRYGQLVKHTVGHEFRNRQLKKLRRGPTRPFNEQRN